MHISSLRWRSGGDEAAPQSGSGVSGVFAYLLQLCVLHVYLVQPALAAWYSADETVLSHGIVCHKMDQEVQLGRLCSVEQAVYQERLQTPDNRHMLVQLFTLQDPKLASHTFAATCMMHVDTVLDMTLRALLVCCGF